MFKETDIQSYSHRHHETQQMVSSGINLYSSENCQRAIQVFRKKQKQKRQDNKYLLSGDRFFPASLGFVSWEISILALKEEGGWSTSQRAQMG